MLGEALEAAGIARGDYAIRINNRKVLNGVMEVAGVLDPADPERDASRRGVVMRAIDKLDRLGEAGVRALLGAGRRDESGDFTAGAGLGEAQAAMILDFMAARAGDAAATCGRLKDLVGASAVGLEGVEELETIAELLAARGAGAVIDPSVVRGLGYYTGPVYEAELTFEVLGEDGRPRQFGSVAGGGRYDDLVRRFTGETVAATGVSVGVDRLLAALGEKGRLASREAGPVVVTVMDRERMADYQAMAAELRAGGLRAEVFLGGGTMGRQLKYADQRGSAVAVIEGGDERARGIVQLKDLALGARLAAEIETHDDWRAQPAQVEVPRAGLVEAVRAMLARGA
jgi:histidyl-tRNA synthetase